MISILWLPLSSASPSPTGTTSPGPVAKPAQAPQGKGGAFALWGADGAGGGGEGTYVSLAQTRIPPSSLGLHF